MKMKVDKLKKIKKPVTLLKQKKKSLMEPKRIKKKMQSMSVDDFMSGFTNSVQKREKKFKKKLINNNSHEIISKKNHNKEQKTDDDNNSVYSTQNNSDEDYIPTDEENEMANHKMQLKGLKESDPEFYKYLEENDQDLLNFGDSDITTDEEHENDSIHQPPDLLEVASDESDYEPEEEVINKYGRGNKVTKEMITMWQQKLHGKSKIQDLREISQAFHAAVVSVSEEKDSTCLYKVEGAVVFNSVIRMCVIDFLPGIQKFLKMKNKSSPAKCKYWSRIKPILKVYLTDLAELSTVTSPSMLQVLLKHIHQLCSFIVHFPIIAQKFLKRLIQLWATDEDIIRVLAFLGVLRLSNLRSSILKRALKIMYSTYVKNTKFISPTSLPSINFMRQSLCEMFALDNTISYHMVFLYIRQLAINLRSAVTQKKKEAYRMVYNWAYVSSLHLWSELFGVLPNNSPLKSLVYPLIQIIIGAIKLIPSSCYYPLRFHCCKILIHIKYKCDVFIPVLPFLLEILRDFNFSKEHKKLTLKPIDFTCLLRCSKSQMKENGFKDAVMENIYSLLIEYIMTECHKLSFPDIMVPCIIQMKKFLKTCKVPNYTKKIKSILDKIIENSSFIEGERKKLSLKINDLSGVEAIEVGIKAREPPFLKYYESWKKIHMQHQARKVTNIHAFGELNLPTIRKSSKKKGNEKLDEKTVLFPSDEDSDELEIFDEKEEPAINKKRKVKPKIKNKIKQELQSETIEDRFEENDSDIDDSGDIIEDLTYSDFK